MPLPKTADEFNKRFNIPVGNTQWIYHYGKHNYAEGVTPPTAMSLFLDEFDKCSIPFDELCANAPEPVLSYMLSLNGECAGLFCVENGEWRCVEAYGDYYWLIENSIDGIKNRIEASKMNKKWERVC